MKPLDSLFNLVHSLNENEKKYFRTYSSRHIIGNKNNYEKLFDLFCQLPADKPYDESELKKLLRGKSYGKNLAVEKKNLYDQILVSMRILHAEDTPENLLTSIITDLRFLADKSLGFEALKELEKAFKLAKETENLPVHLYLYRLKQRLSPSTPTEDGIKELENDFEQEKDILRLHRADRALLNIRKKTYNLYAQNKLKQQIPELKQRIDELMTETSSLSLPYSCKANYLITMALIAEKAGDYKEGMEFYEQLLDLWERHPLNIHGSNTYVGVLLSNYLVCAHHCERFDVFPEIIDKMEQIPAENIREESERFLRSKEFRLLYMLNSPNKNPPDGLVKEIETGLRKFDSFISRNKQINLRMNICILFLQNNDYNHLIDALNKTYLLIGRDEKLNSLIRDLKFYEIMAHIGLKNHDLLSYQFDNIERWLREHEYRNEFTIELLKTLRKYGPENRQAKANGQLTEVNCPQEMLMLRELSLQWINRR